MKRLLLLNEEQFPKDYDSIDVIPPREIGKKEYVERRILLALNQHNPKLNVTGIEYLPIETQFSNYKKGKRNGVLIEEFYINPELASVYKANGNFVTTIGDKCICRRIIMYIFISPAVENTRTAFISQTIFPSLLDYVAEYLTSPSYTIANHNFCFINILNKKITSSMISRHLASLCAAGMEYVEVFERKSIEVDSIPIDLLSFLQLYDPSFSTNYNTSTEIYENDNYRVNFCDRTFYWKASEMAKTKIIKDDRNPNMVQFQGSSEKFYWIETLPIALFAYNQGFVVDYSEYIDFINEYKSRFPETSGKFFRCKILLKYMKKYFV